MKVQRYPLMYGTVRSLRLPAIYSPRRHRIQSHTSTAEIMDVRQANTLQSTGKHQWMLADEQNIQSSEGKQQRTTDEMAETKTFTPLYFIVGPPSPPCSPSHSRHTVRYFPPFSCLVDPGCQTQIQLSTLKLTFTRRIID